MAAASQPVLPCALSVCGALQRARNGLVIYVICLCAQCAGDCLGSKASAVECYCLLQLLLANNCCYLFIYFQRQAPTSSNLIIIIIDFCLCCNKMLRLPLLLVLLVLLLLSLHDIGLLQWMASHGMAQRNGITLECCAWLTHTCEIYTYTCMNFLGHSHLWLKILQAICRRWWITVTLGCTLF